MTYNGYYIGNGNYLKIDEDGKYLIIPQDGVILLGRCTVLRPDKWARLEKALNETSLKACPALKKIAQIVSGRDIKIKIGDMSIRNIIKDETT